MADQNKHSHILIVEDSKTQAELLSYLLGHSGYGVTVVHSGSEALEVIGKNPPSLVITDIVMPVMNGYDLCRAIRANPSTAGIPVILLTSLASPQDIVLSLECGADDFISKPYDADFLISKLEKFFNILNHNVELDACGNSEEVFYSGKSYNITGNRQKMLDLMISAYEAAIQKNHELLEAQDALVTSNRQLEITVDDKEKALEDVRLKEETLRQWNSELNIMNILGSVINQSITHEELFQCVAEEIMKHGFAGTRFGVEFTLNTQNDKVRQFYRYRMKDGEIDFCGSGDKISDLSDKSDQEDLINITLCCDSESCWWKNNGTDSDHGHISIQLIAGDRIIGLCEFITEKDYNPQEHVCEMLISLGKQLGMAIQNHNLLSETKRLSLHDPLTGLANRRMIDLTLETQMARANRYNDLFCLVMLDIDHFKQYNDKFGHDEGDRILSALSSYLKENVRDTDLAARFGGEEFILIISEIGLNDVCGIAERHLELIHERVGITVSMGIAQYRKNQTAEELIKDADLALYRAKENGRNRVELAV